MLARVLQGGFGRVHTLLMGDLGPSFEDGRDQGDELHAS